MIHKKRADLDIILDILNAVVSAKPDSDFAKSLLNQYHERGSLSKKQLEGLHSKASKLEGIPTGKLASLEAVILKMPTKFKSQLPEAKPLFTKEESIGVLIDDILAKYPQHKRVLFFKSKYENNEVLSPSEVDELKKFHRILK